MWNALTYHRKGAEYSVYVVFQFALDRCFRPVIQEQQAVLIKVWKTIIYSFTEINVSWPCAVTFSTS